MRALADEAFRCAINDHFAEQFVDEWNLGPATPLSVETHEIAPSEIQVRVKTMSGTRYFGVKLWEVQ
jgi:hypothetical protein